MEFEQPLGGKYKTKEEADKGIKEADAYIGKLTAELGGLKQQLEAASKPKPPAFSDESGLEAQIKQSGVDISKVAASLVREGKVSDEDAAKIGSVLLSGDPKLIGKKFAELYGKSTIFETDIKQTKAIESAGGKASVDPALKHVQGLPDGTIKSMFNNLWVSDPEAAVKLALGQYAMDNPSTPRGATESAGSTTAGGTKSGFTSAEELIEFRKKARSLGLSLLADDSYINRLHNTPKSIKEQADAITTRQGF